MFPFFQQLDAEDAKSVWGMVTFNGGKCQQKLNKTCTHLVTHDLTSVCIVLDNNR